MSGVVESAPPADAAGFHAGAVVAPWWRRARFWCAFALLIAAAAAVVTAADNRSTGQPLDPASATRAGSQALAQLLRDRGIPVARMTSIDAVAASAGTSAGTVLITDPSLYRADQLEQLAATHRLVLVAPDPELVSRLDPSPTTPPAGGGSADSSASDDTAPAADVNPGCADAGARAAGVVAFSDSLVYPNAPCYEGRVVIEPNLIALGSAALLTNESLGDRGVAALDLNLLSANGQASAISWLVSADDTAASPPGSVWDLFPDWTPRAVYWLLGAGLLVVLWQGRRLAPIVGEPLPVVVRAAEVVEGHGRLYRRAAARETAADALRRATAGRLGKSLGLPPGTPTVTVAAVLNRPGADHLLLGAPPTDDAGLTRLAQGLLDLEQIPPASPAHRRDNPANAAAKDDQP